MTTLIKGYASEKSNTLTEPVTVFRCQHCGEEVYSVETEYYNEYPEEVEDLIDRSYENHEEWCREIWRTGYRYSRHYGRFIELGSDEDLNEYDAIVNSVWEDIRAREKARERRGRRS